MLVVVVVPVVVGGFNNCAKILFALGVVDVLVVLGALGDCLGPHGFGNG